MWGVALSRFKFDWRSRLCTWKKRWTIRTTYNQLLGLCLPLTQAQWFALLLSVIVSSHLFNAFMHSIKTENAAIIPAQQFQRCRRLWTAVKCNHKPGNFTNHPHRLSRALLRAQNLLRLMRAHTCNLSHQQLPHPHPHNKFMKGPALMHIYCLLTHTRPQSVGIKSWMRGSWIK